MKVNVAGAEINLVEPDIESWIAVTLHDVATKAFSVEPEMMQLLLVVLATENEIGLPFPPEVLRFINWLTVPKSVELVMRNGLTLLLNIKVTGSDVVVLKLVSFGFNIATTLQ